MFQLSLGPMALFVKRKGSSVRVPELREGMPALGTSGFGHALVVHEHLAPFLQTLVASDMPTGGLRLVLRHTLANHAKAGVIQLRGAILLWLSHGSGANNLLL